VCDFLVRAGCDVNIQTDEGWGALERCVCMCECVPVPIYNVIILYYINYILHYTTRTHTHYTTAQLLPFCAKRLSYVLSSLSRYECMHECVCERVCMW
jgi:hypothetical protein